MVCDKVVSKMVCDKVVCERLCVCVKIVCAREGVTKLCVKDGVTKETQARHQSQPQDGEMGFEQNQFGKKNADCAERV